MNLLTKLFVLATFLGSLSAIDRKEPIETPDWFNNPPQNYVAAVGSTIEKAFLNVIHDYSQQKGFDHYMEKMLLSKIKQDKELFDKFRASELENYEQILTEFDIPFGIMEVSGYMTKVIEETGYGDESKHIEKFSQSIEVVFINEKYNMRAVIKYNVEETGLGEDSEFIDNISLSYKNCDFNDLIIHLRRLGYDIKYEIRGDRYFFLLGETNNK